MSLKVLELFAGIGAVSKALTRLNIDFEIVDAVEIDKYAIKSFNAVHGTNFKPQDISNWDKNIEVDLISHGSPCQDFSLAGKGAGGDKGSGTRSSLMYETIRIVEKLKPKYVIWENVKNLLGKKHRHNFDAYLQTMESLGYTNYYEVLNAKDYGIPQNRERVFTISILNNDDYTFPPKQELKLKLKDMLEDEVDDKYYLSEKMIKYISANNEKWTGNNDKSIINKSVASAINTGEGSRRCDASNYISNDVEDNFNLKEKPRVIAGIGEKKSNGGAQWYQQDRIYDNKIAISIATTFNPYHLEDYESVQNIRIRKLTPKECWRLQGFDDEDFEKAAMVNSNAQLYKQAGNSICVPVLEAMFSRLLIKDE